MSTINTLRIDRLKAMHTFMCNSNDENLYIRWVTLGVPDEPSEEDFISIAEDNNMYKEICDVFRELVSKKGWE